MAGTTALTALTDEVRLREGQRLLVRGAGGGVGPFDVVVDLVGTDLPAFRRKLSPRGRMVALDPDHLVRTVAFVARGGVAASRKVVGFSNNPSAARIAELTRYVEDGAIRPVVDTVLPMDGIVEAHRRIEAGGVRGKIVIDVR